jgi:hypothetical protein
MRIGSNVETKGGTKHPHPMKTKKDEANQRPLARFNYALHTTNRVEKNDRARTKRMIIVNEIVNKTSNE